MTLDIMERRADNLIALLHMKCTRGIYSARLFRTVATGNGSYYTGEKLSWMDGFLESENQQIAGGCLECLVSHGKKLSDFSSLIESRLNDRIFSNKVIELAERLNDPDTLLTFMEEDNVYLNRVIIAMKKTGNESYLTSLMMSDNETLAKAINRIIKDDGQA